MESILRNLGRIASVVLAIVLVLASAGAQAASIASARALPDGWGTGSLTNAMVTYKGSGFYYVQQRTGLPGVRVSGTGGNPGIIYATLKGNMATGSSGERFITNVSRTSSGTASVRPVCLPIRSLAGGPWQFTEGSSAGQRGATDGVGLNAVGLLIKTFGHFTYVDGSTFLLDDGSGASVKCVYSGPPAPNPIWDCLCVDGVVGLVSEGSPAIFRPVLYVSSVDIVSPRETLDVGQATGELNPTLGTAYRYSVAVSASYGSKWEYRIDWGDGTSSEWEDWTRSASHAWQVAGTKAVVVKARIIGRPATVTSSEPLVVNVVDPGPGWTQLGPFIGPVGSFAFAPNGRVFAATGQGQADNLGHVWRSDDGGLSWTPVSGPGGADVLVTRDGTVLASDGGLRRVWISPDGGLSWDYRDADVYGRMIETKSGAIFGLGGGVMVSRDHGDTWAVSYSYATGGQFPEDIVEDEAGTLYVGTDKGILVSRNAGVSWVQIGSGLPANPNIISLALASDGSLYAGTIANGLYRSPDHGDTWTQLSLPVQDREYRVAVDSRGAVYAACSNSYTYTASSHNCVLRSDDSGTTWQEIRSWADPKDHPHGVAVSPGGDVFVGTAIAGIAKSTDSGSTWAVSHVANCNVRGMLVTHAGTVLAMVDGFCDNASTELFRLNSGSTSWERTGMASILPLAESGTYLYAASAGSPAGAHVSRSADDGRTWYEVGNGLPANTSSTVTWGISDIAISPSGAVYAVAAALERGGSGSMRMYYRLYRLNGEQWQEIAGAFPNGTAIKPCFSSSGRMLIADEVDLRSSDDGGTTWTTRMPMTTGEYFRWLIPCSGNRLYAVDLHRTCLSTDDGATWSTVSSVGEPFAEGQDGYFYTCSGKKTSDPSLPWVPFGTGMPFVLSPPTIAPDGHLIVSPGFGGIYRSIISTKP